MDAKSTPGTYCGRKDYVNGNDIRENWKLILEGIEYINAAYHFM